MRESRYRRRRKHSGIEYTARRGKDRDQRKGCAMTKESVTKTYGLDKRETRMAEAKDIKTKDAPCPHCGHNTFFSLGSTTGPWFTICCQNCGAKMEFLIDLLLKGVGEETDHAK